jgi:polygalacturonase
MIRRHLICGLVTSLLLSLPSFATNPVFNIRDYGAIGDGVTIDSNAINEAIQEAAASGGGTVWFPAGIYASYSIRLKSNITLHLDAGATLLAAYRSPDGKQGYDPAEPNVWGDEHRYQDFGHSHWRNSLIWGENLENVSIIGSGRIDGRALRGARQVILPGESFAQSGERVRDSDPGVGNKAIALKGCRNVTLRDFSIFRGGHFALLATGVDNLTIDNVRVDTNRDGFDIDCCRNVRISNCHVNSPHDDAIVFKSSYALGEARATENVTLTNCQVSGYGIGSLLDGTFDRSVERAPDGDGPTGRIKFGTESNGGFKNIVISNCVFDRCRGLALEIVDGGVMEDVSITNITMRDIVNCPLFIRLGNRGRGPDGTQVGSIRRINISDINVYDADSRYASLISGLPGHNIEDVRLSNIRILYKGGFTMAQVAAQPAELLNDFFSRRESPGSAGPRDPFHVPEHEKGYPEPSIFGLLPAYGLYVRHAENIKVKDVEFTLANADERSAVVLDDVADIAFENFSAQTSGEASVFKLFNVSDFSTFRVEEVADRYLKHVETDSF